MSSRFSNHWYVLLLVCLWTAGVVQAQSTIFNGVTVPGVVIDHSPKNTEIYLTSPNIVIMPDGSYIAALRGDANLDGHVNLAGLQILGDNWQSTSADWTTGDFTGDGIVNLADLQILGDHWDDIAADFIDMASNIPEPGSVLLFGGTAVWVCIRRCN